MMFSGILTVIFGESYMYLTRQLNNICVYENKLKLRHRIYMILVAFSISESFLFDPLFIQYDSMNFLDDTLTQTYTPITPNPPNDTTIAAKYCTSS